ncbi:hypothetical protein RvY_13038 [Ramazzottius varieornatus]|uniref:Uncharacterized protein n=1 Tax=Ramazzottius varieornatus TaxID=947166 RepID=A0A1D1VNR6_RAMVA|nr:hypothetical protein RvY_13038 [Ramazzottius varieornatus]
MRHSIGPSVLLVSQHMPSCFIALFGLYPYQIGNDIFFLILVIYAGSPLLCLKSDTFIIMVHFPGPQRSRNRLRCCYLCCYVEALTRRNTPRSRLQHTSPGDRKSSVPPQQRLTSDKPSADRLCTLVLWLREEV